jgi:hypothetical protein
VPLGRGGASGIGSAPFLLCERRSTTDYRGFWMAQQAVACWQILCRSFINNKGEATNGPNEHNEMHVLRPNNQL